MRVRRGGVRVSGNGDDLDDDLDDLDDLDDDNDDLDDDDDDDDVSRPILVWRRLVSS